MEIRGAGPTYGATGPNMDPRTQAQYDVNALERYTQQFKDDLAALSKDPSNPQLKQAVQNDFKAMSAAMSDLQKLAPLLPKNVQELIGNAADLLDKMGSQMQQISSLKIDQFQAMLDTIKDNL